MCTKLMMEALILHEIVHWAYWGLDHPEPEEMGQKFEMQAYGYRPSGNFSSCREQVQQEYDEEFDQVFGPVTDIID